MGRSICFHRSLWFFPFKLPGCVDGTNSVFVTNDHQWLKLMNLNNHYQWFIEMIQYQMVPMRRPQTVLTTNDPDYDSDDLTRLRLFLVKSTELTSLKSPGKITILTPLILTIWPNNDLCDPMKSQFLYFIHSILILGRKAVFDISLSSSGNRADWLPVRAPRSFELLRPVRRCQPT